MRAIAENLARVRDKIADAAIRVGRDPGDICLVAVSKTKPARLIEEAFESGQRIFGENYAREMAEKAGSLPQEIEWHFIGALQRNKAKLVVEKATFIHSLDRLSLAQELDKRASKPVKTLIEVNIAGEKSKTGTEAQKAGELIEECSKLGNIDIRGLMTMPPFFDNPDRAKPYFARLRELRDELARQTGLELKELSMGMSGDYEAAIEEGATIVRVGAAIFGPRY